MIRKMNSQVLIRLIVPYMKTIIVIFVSLLIATVITFYIPILSKNVMDDGFIGGNYGMLIRTALIMLLLNTIIVLLELFKEKLRIDIQGKIKLKLEKEAFQHILKLKIKYFDDLNHTELLANIDRDITNMSLIADDNVLFVFTKIFNIIGGTIGLVYINWKLGLLVVVFFPIKYVVMLYFAKIRIRLMEQYIQGIQKYTKWFANSVAGIKEIRLFGVESQKDNEFDGKATGVIEKEKKLNFIERSKQGSDIMFMNVLTTIIYIIGANMVLHYKLSVGSVFAFITYSTFVIDPISSILSIKYFLSGILPSTKRYLEFMEMEEENYSGKRIGDLSGEEIRFKDVTFSYTTEHPILQNINLHICKGDKVALVGKNGTGKTTLIEVLLRLYDKTRGKIEVDGIEVESISLNYYREQFSVVSQNIYLFNDTLLNNLCLYQEMNMNNVMDTINDAGLMEFVNTYSLNFAVGENGCRLSGGQKQKVALARALLQNRPIIIFDEATSSADAEAEMQLHKLLQTKLKEKIVIIISHKSDILEQVNRVICLENGKIKVQS